MCKFNSNFSSWIIHRPIPNRNYIILLCWTSSHSLTCVLWPRTNDFFIDESISRSPRSPHIHPVEAGKDDATTMSIIHSTWELRRCWCDLDLILNVLLCSHFGQEEKKFWNERYWFWCSLISSFLYFLAMRRILIIGRFLILLNENGALEICITTTLSKKLEDGLEVPPVPTSRLTDSLAIKRLITWWMVQWSSSSSWPGNLLFTPYDE